MKKIIALAMVCILTVGVLAIPAFATDMDTPTYVENDERISYNPACPTCGRIGVWLYDTEMPDPIALILATYSCPQHGIYQFYRTK